MSKVMTFARQFPAKHPRAGQPTYFVEKIWACLADMLPDFSIPDVDGDFHEYYNATPKNHTIRAGSCWKVGGKFSPRSWSGLPYRSQQIIIAPDIEIKRVVDIQLLHDGNDMLMKLNGKRPSIRETEPTFRALAINDGLSIEDFKDWFSLSTPFSGQIIIWNDSNLLY